MNLLFVQLDVKERTALVVLCSTFALLSLGRVAFDVLTNYERSENFSGRAVDAPHYGIPLYHVIAVLLAFTILFARKYLTSLVIATAYFVLHIYAISIRLQGCFLGGDICPPVPLSQKIFQRLDWIDGVVLIVLPFLICWLINIFYRFRSFSKFG